LRPHKPSRTGFICKSHDPNLRIVKLPIKATYVRIFEHSHQSAGHRIRIEIAPGDSPYFDGFSHYFGVKFGTDSVCHNTMYPSHMLLPILT